MSSIHARARDFALMDDGRSHSTRWTAMVGAAVALALTLAVFASPLFTARTLEDPATTISIYGP